MSTPTPPATTSSSTSSTPSPRSLTVMLWVVATGFFMQTLDSTIVNTALPAMATSLGELPLRMQSVVIAYSLTMAVMIPVSGWLADKLGTRRVFFSAILVFAVGSLLCANAHTLNQLVTFRVMQGVGGAMLLPVGRLAVLRTFPAERYLPALVVRGDPGAHRTADRPDARRLAREDRLVALDLSDQRAGGNRRLHRHVQLTCRIAAIRHVGSST